MTDESPASPFQPTAPTELEPVDGAAPADAPPQARVLTQEPIKPKRVRWPWIILGAVIAVVVLGSVSAFAFLVGARTGEKEVSQPAASATTLGDSEVILLGPTAETFFGPLWASGDKESATILIGSLNADADTFARLEKFLAVLGFSSGTMSRIKGTRALDGTLTAESPDGYSASWTYHPDDGLRLVVERD